jgi:hypothetical protein
MPGIWGGCYTPIVVAMNLGLTGALGGARHSRSAILVMTLLNCSAGSISNRFMTAAMAYFSSAALHGPEVLHPDQIDGPAGHDVGARGGAERANTRHQLSAREIGLQAFVARVTGRRIH